MPKAKPSKATSRPARKEAKAAAVAVPPQHPDDVPHVPAHHSIAEITFKGLLLGLVLAVLLGAANTYLGLKAGLTVAASIPAAVVSLAVLKLFRRRTILENNIVQTIASAGTSVASGAIFTIPALILLGYWERLHYWETTFIVIVGGLLGVLFSVPIRRALVVEEKLPFPEGQATGEVLKAGEAGGVGIQALLLGGVLGAAYKVLQGGLRFWREGPTGTIPLGSRSVLGIGFNLSPALMGVGVIIGLPIASLVFLGGVLGWVVGIPLYTQFAGDVYSAAHGAPSLFDVAGSSDALPAVIWSRRIRYIGVGAMLVGGLWSLVKLRKPLTRAIVAGVRSAGRSGGDAGTVPRTERDLPFTLVGLGAIVLAVPMAMLFNAVLGSLAVAIVIAVLMLVVGFLFSAVGGYMAGIVGSSNSPVSGVTILALLASCLALLAFAVAPDVGPPAAIFVAAVVCVAASISGDNLQDLKAGRILGSTPWKQQLMIMVGAIASAFAIAPVIQTLIDGAGATPDQPLGNIAAPQANLMATLASAVFSDEGLSVQAPMIVVGALLAIVLIVTDWLLAKRGSAFRTPVMPVAVGIYLPVGTSVPIFVGGLAAWAGERWYRRAKEHGGRLWADAATNGGRMAILFASGLIAGEAILGIATAFLAANGYHVELGPASFDAFSAGERHDWGGFLLLAYLVFMAWYVAIRPGLQQRRDAAH
ncbi:MAG TPA: oligopeptide transporter, OPT family [Candidatus Thermoplasmatota archaeon]|nr:oligopeptide transporter, OPT family [Candidatus Thermoplasmatota archaeon]